MYNFSLQYVFHFVYPFYFTAAIFDDYGQRFAISDLSSLFFFLSSSLSLSRVSNRNQINVSYEFQYHFKVLFSPILPVPFSNFTFFLRSETLILGTTATKFGIIP